MPGDKKGVVCQTIFDKGGPIGSGLGNVVCQYFPTISEDITKPLVNLANNMNDNLYKLGESIGNGIVNTTIGTANFAVSANNTLGQAIINDTSRSLGTMSHSDFMNNFNIDSSSNFNSSNSNGFIGNTGFGTNSGGFDFGLKF
ncbi:MAG: hypothetical protein U1E31_02320 [Rickettsiales bacterium]